MNKPPILPKNKKPPYVRVVGEGLDISLAVESESDIEIVEQAIRLLFDRFKQEINQ